MLLIAARCVSGIETAAQCDVHAAKALCHALDKQTCYICTALIGDTVDVKSDVGYAGWLIARLCSNCSAGVCTVQRPHLTYTAVLSLMHHRNAAANTTCCY